MNSNSLLMINKNLDNDLFEYYRFKFQLFKFIIYIIDY